MNIVAGDIWAHVVSSIALAILDAAEIITWNDVEVITEAAIDDTIWASAGTATEAASKCCVREE